MTKTQKLYEALKTAVTVLRDLEALAGEVHEEQSMGNCEHKGDEDEICMKEHGVMDEDEYSDLMCDVNRAAESCESAAESAKEFINSKTE